MSLDLEACIAGIRQNKTQIEDLQKDLSEFDAILSKTADIIWILSQYANLKDGRKQTIPCWTGFHHLTAGNVPPNIYHQVAYLPSINSSPTKMSTVQEVLIQVKQKAEKLGLTEADLVLDHTIYSKALEILMNPVNEEYRKFIVIRMSGSHTKIYRYNRQALQRCWT